MNKEQALLRLSSLAATSECCEYDFRKKMTRWLLPEEEQTQIIERLITEGFIDPERYARAFVRDKFRFNHWGRVRISTELRRRHISNDIINAALEEIPADDNLDSLRTLLQSKMRTVRGKSDYDVRCKLIRFALGRGFVMGDILKVLGSLGQNVDEDEFPDI